MSKTKSLYWDHIERLNFEEEFGKIVTSFVYPPIPTRNSDWCAYIDGTEESGRYGWGATEQEAIEDLMEMETFQ
jgi:hypothetical protein